MKLIAGSIVIYGRKIFEVELKSKPLPRCQNIVLSRSPAFVASNSFAVSSLPKAIELAHSYDSDASIWILGGTEIYTEALPLASKLHLTEVHCDHMEGDTYFPDEWRDHFQTVLAERMSSNGTYNYTFKEIIP
jgi:dihydrofolate reductase